MLGINKKMARMNVAKITDTKGNTFTQGQKLNKEAAKIHAKPTTSKITITYTNGHTETMSKARFEALANCKKAENFLRK